MSLLADKTRLVRLEHSVTLTFSAPPWIKLSGSMGEYLGLISLENLSVSISHFVPSQCLNTISVQPCSTGTELRAKPVIGLRNLMEDDSC